MARKKKGPVDRFDSAWWEIRQEDDTGKVYWWGCGVADKEVTRIDGPLTMDPSHFPPGTRIDVNEPWDEEFYDRLFDERAKMLDEWRKSHSDET